MKRLPLALLTLALATGAQAQMKAGTQVLSLDFGVADPLARYYTPDVRVGNIGPSVGGQYLYYLKPSVGIGLDLGYDAFKEKPHDNGIYHLTSSPKLLQMMLVGKYSFFPELKYRPDVLGGVGMGYFWLKKTQCPRPGSAWPDTGTSETRNPVDSASAGVSFALAGGIDLDVSKRFMLGMDLRWSQTSIDKNKFWSHRLQVFNAMATLGYKFKTK